MEYNATGNVEIRETETFVRWFATLRDPEARARISVRLRRLSLRLFGDVRRVGSGVSELRIDYGPGYRVYLATRGDTLVVLLGGGDKRTQQRDIARAIKLAQRL